MKTESATTKRAAIYLRVSTAQQAERDGDPEGYSIPAQRDACVRKALSLGAVVVDEYVDRGESAKTADRPALRALLERVQTDRDIDYLIVHKVDRLARKLEDDVVISAALQGAGVQLVSATENIDETPSGRLLHGIMASIAEFYSRNLATEVLKGSVKKAESGGTPTRAPIGYLNVRRIDDGRELRTIELDPERAPLIEWAFASYATGRFTLRGLLLGLTDKGLTTRPSAKIAAKPLSMSRLAALLHNRYYVGVVTYRGVEYEGRHQPLVDPDTFNRVQQAFAAHNLAGEKVRSHPHYLKGTVFCARCGARLGITMARGNGGIYPYFFCYGRQRGLGCDQPYMGLDDVEDGVTRHYALIQLEPDRIEAVRRELRWELETIRLRTEKEVKRQQTRVARLTDQRAKLLTAYYAQAMPLDLFKNEQGRISREIEEANAVLSVRAMQFAQIEDTILKAVDLAGCCQEAYRLASDRVRRQFNQAFFTKLLIDSGEVRGSELTDYFALALAEDVSKEFRRELPQPASLGVGSIFDRLVEEKGIEPRKRGNDSERLRLE